MEVNDAKMVRRIQPGETVELRTSPPLRLPRAQFVGMLTVSLRNLTQPSPNVKLHCDAPVGLA